ncbi:SDR family NAD(P)-dependent oxidoreductase [Alicyclobacillus sp. ALC3]|uniref:SDR family NAD(P)-dependent oxidoreductase n=1 Tax=Alicyclobacillus sp. ALC3 TaxID=2796143 RepID=UPI0023791923|nr:SDR family NAD(P)-dependent oxidoreductase [Alicyclobacillus sp. ALC3]WDL99117.1 SDR family NAD(P)-dependent oxidoreductase [Alicyclobacillus sp. ALC3]
MTAVNSKVEKQSNTPVVVITGGTQGLGLALAQALLNAGFAVSLCARTGADVEAARMLLTRKHRNSVVGEQLGQSVDSDPARLLAMPGDVADRDFQRALIAKTAETFGRIDAVVNNASTLGILPMPSVTDSTTENEAQVFDVNVFAPLQLIRLALPHLATQTQSLILGISSDAAVGGYPGWGVYGASKAALDLFHKTLAAELADQRILVHSVDPGDMDTAMHRAADPGAQGLTSPAAVAAALLALFQPLKGENKFLFTNGVRLQVTRDGLMEVTA